VTSIITFGGSKRVPLLSSRMVLWIAGCSEGPSCAGSRSPDAAARRSHLINAVELPATNQRLRSLPPPWPLPSPSRLDRALSRGNTVRPFTTRSSRPARLVTPRSTAGLPTTAALGGASSCWDRIQQHDSEWCTQFGLDGVTCSPWTFMGRPPQARWSRSRRRPSVVQRALAGKHVAWTIRPTPATPGWTASQDTR
jgi:hypothetical protein